jgi:hypothetical protein
MITHVTLNTIKWCGLFELICHYLALGIYWDATMLTLLQPFLEIYWGVMI